ncbi:MAG: hypothetical protein GY739_09005, partial [Mesoflavibacter sp.]|nr:hypothetical protein [Mesoflavibacter sp.]
RLQDVDVLVIDEVSMLTPVTLARIDLHLRCAFNKDYVFGGKDIVLVGDFFQFPPISDNNIPFMALYQAAVRIQRNPHIYVHNTNYEKGARLFMLFQLVQLRGQERAEEKYKQWLDKLRDYNTEHPIDDDFLDEMNILNSKDMEDEKIDWALTPTIVTGHFERRKIIQHKMTLFAKRTQQPILRWVNKVATGKLNTDKRKNNYRKLGFDPEVENMYPELIQYFVRGAEIRLTKKVHGFPKGTLATYVGVAWKNKNDEEDLDILPTGKIKTVEVPEYIIIKIKPKKTKEEEKEHVKSLPARKFIPLKPVYHRFEDKIATSKAPKDSKGRKQPKYRAYERHPCQLTISRTYHVTQGATYNCIILSLNSVLANAQKIKVFDIISFYVGLSRVHNFDELRVLDFSPEQRDALKKLTLDPLLKAYFNNYDDDGNWNFEGLREEHENNLKEATLELGMIAKHLLTNDDCAEFIKRLDLHMKGSKNSENYKKCIKKPHSKGRKLLHNNNNKLLHKKRKEFTKKFLEENYDKMTLKRMKYWAKRLGMKTTQRYKIEVTSYLDKIIRKSNIHIDSDVDESSEHSNENNNSEIDEDDDIQMNISNTNRNIIEINEDEDIHMNIFNTENSQSDDNVNYGPDNNENDEKGQEIHTNNECSCNCHIKGEMDDVNHCNKCYE